ncbi:MAG TPA: hypothetical protein DCL43_16620 [Chitinophagaceae bacterium]|nr:hypothetical protein [Chitinophagaceae bacterium]
MVELIKKILEKSGIEIKKFSNEVGSIGRPVGRMDTLLEDLKQRGLACNTVMDVGANRTTWSRLAKQTFPNADFCLIEPQIEMKQYLDAFCNEYKNAVYFLAGAGPQKDVLTLTIWDDLDGSSFLPRPDEKLKQSGRQREIEIIAIDDLITSSTIKIPELIKLDIQGYELESLKGAEKTFGYTEAYILEVALFPFSDVPGMPILSDVMNFMLARDYVIYDFAGFFRRPLDGALGQCDICFVKKNGFLRKSNKWK